MYSLQWYSTTRMLAVTILIHIITYTKSQNLQQYYNFFFYINIIWYSIIDVSIIFKYILRIRGRIQCNKMKCTIIEIYDYVQGNL